MTDQPAFRVVGCSSCSATWIIESDPSAGSAECPDCGTTHQRGSLRSLASGDDPDVIRELRSRIMAARSGHEDEAAALDDYGVLEDQVEDYFDRRDQLIDDVVAGGGDVDLHPIHSERFADQAHAHLERQERRYEAHADAALGLYDDKFEGVGTDDWRHDVRAGAVRDRLEQWGTDPDSVDARTGELALDDQLPADTTATVTLDAESTATGLWASMFQRPEVHEAFVAGCRRFASDRSPSDLSDALQRYGVAHDIRGTIQRLGRLDTSGVDAETEQDAIRRLVYGDAETTGLCKLARRLGTQRADRDALTGTARLLGWATPENDVAAPTIAVRLTEAFRDRPREQREAVVDLLWALSRHCEVVVVGSPIDLRWMAVDHELDRGSFSERWTGRRGTAQIDERTNRALDSLDRDSSATDLLRCLHDASGERLPYAALCDALDVSTARISQIISSDDPSLRDLGLVETISAGGQTIVELSPAGRETIEAIDAEIGRQRDLGEWLDAPLSDQLNSSDHGRVTPREDVGGDGTDPRRKGEGLAPVGTLSRAHAAGAVGAAEPGGIALVDSAVAKAADYRCSQVWVDDDGGRVVTSAEYVNPMQYWVSIARSLTHWRVWEYALTADRMESADHEFADLFDEHRQLLRSSRCLGHLPDEVEDVDDYADALQDARDHLEQMTTRLADEDFEDESRFRGAILREAHGLVGTMVHLCDLCGVDVVRELRLPAFSGDFDADRWEDLTKTLAIGTAIQSRYGQFAAYRQLFENRDEKLEWTTFADVDAADPTGEMIGSMVVVGNFGDRRGEKRASFVDDLRSALRRPRNVREDAPEFRVPISVRAFEHGREHVATAAARIASRKHLRLTRDAVSLLMLFASTPYAAATALNWLDSESLSREIEIAEVRYALSKLPVESLLPACRPGARRIVKALLAADEPLTTAELTSNKWAGVDRATLSRSDNSAPGDRLQALGLLTKTEEGWRLPLSFHETERHETVLPTMVDDADQLFVRDILFEVAERLVEDGDRWGDGDDPICGCWSSLTSAGIPDCMSLVEEWAWLWDWIPVIEAVVDEPAASIGRGDNTNDNRVAFGLQPDQRPIQQVA